MKKLCELYGEHQGKVSDKWSLYLQEYDRLFQPYRKQPVCLLEIGVQNGGSLELWNKYFPHVKKIVGCDSNPDCAKLQYDDNRIAVVVYDVNTEEAEQQILEHSSNFDLIIDDGSHISGDIIRTFARYFKHLNDNGLFIIEDLHCSYWQEFEGGLFDPFSSITFFKRLADVVNHEHWGVEKPCTDILRGFFSKYGFNFDEETLRQVHSVEFINSIVAIQKRMPQSNILGLRAIAGTTESVTPVLSLSRSPVPVAPSQAMNEWSLCDTPPDEEFLLRIRELAERDATIAEKEGCIGCLEEAVKEKEGRIVSLEEAVKEKEALIQHIYSGHGWRLLTKYFKLRDWLLPCGSKRRIEK